MATSAAALARPSSDEYAPYYEKYIALVPEGDIVTTLTKQLDTTLTLLREIDETQAGKRYAPDKWSIKELLGHVIDTERIFGYRALRFARNDQTPLAGFEQDDYVRSANFDARRFADLTKEFELVRRNTIELFNSLNDEGWSKRGTANNVEVSVRALAYITAGHAAHHVQILKTRYL
jgi:DinB superfamily